MPYVIRVDYEDGDTFKRWKAHTETSVEWNSKDAAKAALKRIAQHNEWFKHCSRGRCWKHHKKCPPKPEWIKDGWDGANSVPVLLDDGTETAIYADWVGYFSSLTRAAVIEKPDTDPDMEYKP